MFVFCLLGLVWCGCSECWLLVVVCWLLVFAFLCFGFVVVVIRFRLKVEGF